MKLLILTRCSNATHPGLNELVKSLKKQGYNYEVIVDARTYWGVDGMKLHADWLKENRKDYTHILHTDAHDTCAIGKEDELIEKYTRIYGQDSFVWSAERKLKYEVGWEKPYLSPTSWRELYEQFGTWRYPCGGGYICPIDLFLEIDDKFDRKHGHNGNQIGSELCLFYKDKWNIKVDGACEIFQAIIREEPGDFAWTRDGRVYNRVTKSLPIFIHGNGGCDLTWVTNPPYCSFYS